MSPKTLHDKLRELATDTFVGRDEIREWFRDACEGKSRSSVLYVHGPGGVGKTTLIRHLADVARDAGSPCCLVDGRVVPAEPESFLSVLNRQFSTNREHQNAGTHASDGHESDGHETDGHETDGHASDGHAAERHAAETVFAALAQLDAAPIILVDTFEEIQALEPWIVREFAPRLPETAVVVLVGRKRPGKVWKTEPGWDQLLRVEALRNFSRADSVAYLNAMGVPADSHDEIIRFSRGHPLALSLFAEIHRQRPEPAFRPNHDPDIIRILLDRFIQKVPSQAHRAALESCAIVRTMTEDLLGAILDADESREVFDWLRDLSFIESGPDGVYPHDLARTVIASDLKWRNAAWYRQLHDRARGFYTSRLHSSDADTQESVLFDYIYLHRDSAVVRPFFESLVGGSPARALRGRFRKSDIDGAIELVHELEGVESAELFRGWFEQQPDRLMLYEDRDGRVIGLLFALGLEADDADAPDDEITQHVASYLRESAPIVSGERATLFRFWMARETYHGLSRTQTQLFVEMVRHYLVTPSLAYSFLPVENPDYWAPILEYADLHRVPQLDYTIGDRAYGVFGHDWRTTPPDAWLDLLGNRELGVTKSESSETADSITALSKEDFLDALDDALKNYAQPWKLVENPLLASSFVASAAPADAGLEDRVTLLQERIVSAVDELAANPKLEKARRAVTRMYIKPAGSQEMAAEVLDMPFSTFRRHLKKGVTELGEALWLIEIG
ncbi:MAG: ATP-binding protein [Rhodothermales bacterium]